MTELIMIETGFLGIQRVRHCPDSLLKFAALTIISLNKAFKKPAYEH